jgi:PAS domain S-box-containing protein
MKHPVRILMLEDSVRDADLLERQLRKGGVSFSGSRVDTQEAFVEQLKEFGPDLIISDYHLPLFDGLQALELVRERLPQLPFILVSGHIGEEKAIEAFKMGATDFILKDRLGRLVPCIQRALREVEDRAKHAQLEQRFCLLVEAAPNAMVMVNVAGVIKMVNAQTERLFGYTRSELLGEPVEMLLPAKSRAQHPGMRTGFCGAPTSRTMGIRRAVFGLKKDGSQVELEIGLSPIETDEGLMVLSAIVDISDRVRLEGQLRQSQKMHAMGRLTAGVAHDFNNLFQALSGSLEMLIDAVADQPAAIQWAELAFRATERGTQLTDRLLSFSRQQVLTARPIIVGKLFCELKRLINHLFETNTKARTELVMMPCPPDLAVLADLAQLETALINLAVNALHAMAFGGCLRFSAYDTDADLVIVPPGRYTVISVADTGSGMNADTLEQAFEPFFTTKGVDGTGLGLSMVHGFARQSGGEAHITSVVGEGTTIDLWLPSATAAPEVAAPIAALVRTSGHILLVDDSQDALVVVSAFLRHSGLHVTSRTSGRLALAELAGGTRFDAIITDFAMPGMNGLELITQAHEIDPSMMAMIITGFSDPNLLSEMNHLIVLRKPFNRAELIKTVQKLLSFALVHE